MVSKVVHYGGFQSYSDLPYPSLKPGKKELESNTIYQETARQEDQLKFYNNTNRWQTLYDQKLSKNVAPEDYQNPLRVTKTQVEKPLLATAGKFITSKAPELKPRTQKEQEEAFDANNKGLQLFYQTVSSLKREKGDLTQSQQRNNAPEQKTGAEQPSDYEFVKTGTEHWKTTYMAGIKDPYAYAKATRPEWSLNKEPYTVKGGPRTTENKGQFGDRGTNPLEKLNRTMRMPPVPKSEDVLKLGSTQSTFHIPGYTGHLPRSLAVPEMWDQAVGANPRTTFLKQNITETYQTRIPGYSGHRPANSVNDRGALRQFCFSTAGERFH